MGIVPTLPKEAVRAAVSRQLERELTEVTKQRDVALSDLEFRRDLYALQTKQLTDMTQQRDDARDEFAQLQKDVALCHDALEESRDSDTTELHTYFKDYKNKLLQLTEVTKQRDRLAEALKEIYNVSSFDYDTMPELARKKYREVVLGMADEALQSITPKAEP
jgi:septal ring factor EnvC (AmiA/AmiB activator)